MAGIGFELRKMIDSSHSLLHSVTSYGLAAVTINGPMVLCIIMVSVARLILGRGVYSGIPADGIFTTVTYGFILSSVITGSYSLILTRYVSDCIYNKEYYKILPSLFGAMIPALFFSMAVSICMVLWGGLKVEYCILVSVLFSVVSIVWLEMIYLSAAKNYKTVIKGFFAGNLLGIMLLCFVHSVLEDWKLQYVFFSFAVGFTATAALLMRQIRRLFGDSKAGFMDWTGYFRKFPSLFMTGLFYTSGLYFLCFYYRFTSSQVFINGFLAMKPEFDLPFFLAVLGIIPGLVYFSVRFETALYTSSKELYSKINNNGTGFEIDYCIQNLTSSVKYYFIKLLMVQGIVMLFMLLAPFALIEINKTVLVFWVLTAGMSATLLMYAVILVILYFDGKGHVLAISFIYLALNVFLTLFLDTSSYGRVGFGFMAASGASLLISIILLSIFIVNLKNYVFIMKQ